MNPIEFDGHNIIIAKDQEGYIPLPAHVGSTESRVFSCWQLTWRERLRVLFGGRVWLCLMTFGKPLQPINLSVDRFKWVPREVK